MRKNNCVSLTKYCEEDPNSHCSQVCSCGYVRIKFKIHFLPNRNNTEGEGGAKENLVDKKQGFSDRCT